MVGCHPTLVGRLVVKLELYQSRVLIHVTLSAMLALVLRAHTWVLLKAASAENIRLLEGVLRPTMIVVPGVVERSVET